MSMAWTVQISFCFYQWYHVSWFFDVTVSLRLKTMWKSYHVFLHERSLKKCLIDLEYSIFLSYLLHYIANIYDDIINRLFYPLSVPFISYLSYSYSHFLFIRWLYFFRVNVLVTWNDTCIYCEIQQLETYTHKKSDNNLTYVMQKKRLYCQKSSFGLDVHMCISFGHVYNFKTKKCTI